VEIDPPVRPGDIVPLGGWWFEALAWKDDMLVLRLREPTNRTKAGLLGKVKGRAPAGCSKRRHRKR
jgi:hypothetical protein